MSDLNRVVIKHTGNGWIVCHACDKSEIAIDEFFKTGWDAIEGATLQRYHIQNYLDVISCISA